MTSDSAVLRATDLAISVADRALGQYLHCVARRSCTLSRRGGVHPGVVLLGGHNGFASSWIHGPNVEKVGRRRHRLEADCLVIIERSLVRAVIGSIGVEYSTRCRT